MPGIDTTPKPAEGLASSLTAIGPEARTTIVQLLRAADHKDEFVAQVLDRLSQSAPRFFYRYSLIAAILSVPPPTA